VKTRGFFFWGTPNPTPIFENTKKERVVAMATTLCSITNFLKKLWLLSGLGGFGLDVLGAFGWGRRSIALLGATRIAAATNQNRRDQRKHQSSGPKKAPTETSKK